MKKLLQSLFVILLLFTKTALAQDCNNGRYLEPIFSKVDVTRNIKYARKRQSDGQYIDLKYDVYEPHGDTMSQRPVMILIHGGAYLKLLDQNSPDIVLMCNYFAQRGYVCVSIDYRQEPNLLGLLNEEVMVKAVARALLDTKDAIDHMVDGYIAGNPFRVDTSRAIIGGVSAGAVSSMFIAYLDSLQMVPIQYQQWIQQATDSGVSADYVLRHRFDRVKPKIVISISGALLDTNWIVNNNIDFLLDHGSADAIVPYNYGRPFGLPMLPYLYGGKAQYPRMLHEGIRVEFEDWLGRGHVPFMNLDLGSIITFQLINQPILDSTERHIAHFCYRLVDCNERPTSIHQNLFYGSLNIYPNPSRGNFTVQLPKDAGLSKKLLTIYDVSGRQVYSEEISANTENVAIHTSLAPGEYILRLQFDRSGESLVYTSRISVNE